MDLGLQGKRALITGAGRGLGACIAHDLAQQGVEVCLLSRTQSELEAVVASIQADGGKASYQLFDLATDAATDLITRLEATGPIDILIGNAARQTVPAKLTRMPDSEWTEAIETDLNGTYRLLKSVLPGMQERGWGRVILIGSVAGMVGTSAYPAYCTIKAAYEGLVKNLAIDYSKYGITVNLVSPGFIETERFKKAAPPQLLEKFRQASAVKRLAQPEDIAPVVSFLASQQAGFLTGINLPVCGGLNLGNLW